MQMKQTLIRPGLTVAVAAAIWLVLTPTFLRTQGTSPEMLDPTLSVGPAVTGLTTPTSLVFLGADDFLVLEKDTGRVQRVVGGVIQSTVLDLGVNFASERGLLGVALHPDFPVNPGVCLFWTCPSLAPPADPFVPDQ